MTDDVSNAELARRLDSFQRDTHADFTEVFRRLDQYVLREVYAAERGRQEDRIAALEQRVRDGEEQRRTYLRWVISAILIPIVVLVVQVALTLRGGS